MASSATELRSEILALGGTFFAERENQRELGMQWAPRKK